MDLHLILSKGSSSVNACLLLIHSSFLTMDALLAHRQAPVVLALSCDALYVTMDAWYQRLEVLGMPSGQISFMRMVCCEVASLTRSGSRLIR